MKRLILVVVFVALIAACGGEESPNSGLCDFHVNAGKYTVDLEAPCYCHWWLIDEGVDEVVAEERRLECIEYGIYSGE